MFRNNVKKYHNVFASQPMFSHQQAMSELSRFDLSSLLDARRYAKKARGKLPLSSGVQNLFA